MKISELVVGEKINDVCLVLKNIAQRGDTYGIILKDKSGETSALCRAELVTESVLSNIGGVVKITAVVKPGKDRKPELVIKQIAKANSGVAMSGDLLIQLDTYVKAKVDQITEYSNIHTLAYSAKLDALKDCFKQDKTILYKALYRIKGNSKD